MATPALRRAFIIFHLALGVGLLVASLQTLAYALGLAGHIRIHLSTLASVEALGAALFLLPHTLRLGAILLLLTIGIALAVHTVEGEWRPDLVIYAAGTWFVLVHGAAWTGQPGRSDVAV